MLITIPRIESVGNRAVQSHAQKRHVEDVYTHDNYKWIDELPRLVSDYNTRKHCTIGMRPADITPAITESLLDTVYSVIKICWSDKIQSGRFGARE